MSRILYARLATPTWDVQGPLSTPQLFYPGPLDKPGLVRRHPSSSNPTPKMECLFKNSMAFTTASMFWFNYVSP